MSDSTDEVLRVIPLLENLKSQRGETDWLDEQVSTERGSAKCPGVAEDAPEREREKKRTIGGVDVLEVRDAVQIQYSEFDTIRHGLPGGM